VLLAQRAQALAPAARQAHQQLPGQRRQAGETHLQVGVAVHQQQGGLRWRLAWLVLRADAFHRPTVGQHPRHARQQWLAVEQVAVRVVRRVLGVAQVQLRLDPFIVRQFQLPRGIGLDALQVVDERRGNLGEQRCLTAVMGVEIAHARMPAVLRWRHGTARDRPSGAVPRCRAAADWRPGRAGGAPR